MALGELFATLFGYFSIGCWIVVFTPQFYENYTRKNTDGVSIQFLSLWILGDILNLVGIVLENLMFTMLLLAMYYLFADSLLMTQVFYYRKWYPKQHREEVVVNDYGGSVSHNIPNTSDEESSNLLIPSTSSLTISSEKNPKTRMIVRLFFVSSIVLWFTLLGGSALFFYIHQVDWSQWHVTAQLLGWGSAFLYCVSRIPQIMQNFRNESVEGLSLTMFIFSVVGNITYCVSIILESTDPTYLLINYPWLLGSGGTLFFDFTIFFQFWMYRKRTDSTTTDFKTSSIQH